jgi:transposase
MNKKQAIQILEEWHHHGLSSRKLAVKYGIPRSSIYRMIKRQENQAKQEQCRAREDLPMPDDIAALKEELGKARLKIELQDIMIDLASKELGVDIRKKSGTRQS